MEKLQPEALLPQERAAIARCALRGFFLLLRKKTEMKMAMTISGRTSGAVDPPI